MSKPIGIICMTGLFTERGVPQGFRDYVESMRVAAGDGAAAFYTPYSAGGELLIDMVASAARSYRLRAFGHSFGASALKWTADHLGFVVHIERMVWWDFCGDGIRFGHCFNARAGDMDNAARPSMPVNIDAGLAFTQRNGPVGIAGCQVREVDDGSRGNVRLWEHAWGKDLNHETMCNSPEVLAMTRDFLLEGA